MADRKILVERQLAFYRCRQAVPDDFDVGGADCDRVDPHQHLWYYRSLLEVYRSRSASWLVDELARVIDTLAEEIGPPVAATV